MIHDNTPTPPNVSIHQRAFGSRHPLAPGLEDLRPSAEGDEG